MSVRAAISCCRHCVLLCLTVPSVVSFTTGAGVEDSEELLVAGLQLEVTGVDGRGSASS